MPVLSCPKCMATQPEGALRCSCGADLSLLVVLGRIGDRWFDRALRAVGVGQEGVALEWLAASCAANPNDAGARRALAKVWARLNHPAESRRVLEQAREIEPDHPQLIEIEAALDGLAQSTEPEPSPGKKALEDTENDPS